MPEPVTLMPPLTNTAPTAVHWPVPAYVTLTGDAEQEAEPRVALNFVKGGTVRGTLTQFDPDHGILSVRSPGGRISPPMNFDTLKSVRLLHPVTAKATLPDGGLTRPLHVVSLRSKVTLRYTDGEVLEGEIFGYAPHPRGCFLNLIEDGDKVVRCFVPNEAIADLNLGEPLGELLVQSQLATRDSIDAGLREQEALRHRKLGEYLELERVTDPAQLQQALERQKDLPQLRLGELLLREQLITESQLEDALARQKADRTVPLGELLVRMGLVTRPAIKQVLAQKLGVPYVDLPNFHVDLNAVKKLPAKVADRYQVLPIMEMDGTLVVAMDDPTQWEPLRQVSFLTGLQAKPVLASPDELQSAINTYYGQTSEKLDDLARELDNETDMVVLEEVRGDGPLITDTDNTLVRIVNRMILDAEDQGASDIHFEAYPGRKKSRIRFRRDGILHTYFELPPNFRDAFVSRVKIMSQLDISEHRKPQDGKINFERWGPARIELRVATIPTTDGLEDVVMRILHSARMVPVDKLELSPTNLKQVKETVEKPYGLILVCGPTGSGKTTTLHSMLNHINRPERKIWTAEDPVEIRQDGLRQVQMQPKIGWTFANALRAFLRADPDVIMVGEIRDAETAKTALEASLTGHLVFSTLHTNTAAETLVRLIDLGVDPFNVADSLLVVVAQRLARRVCPQCGRREAAPDAEIEALAHAYCEHTPLDPTEIIGEWRKRFTKDGQFLLNRAVGCEACHQSGYLGRVGLHEVLRITPGVKRHIFARSDVDTLRNEAMREGLRTLRQDGIEKVLRGLTDLRQVYAAC